MNFIDRGVEVGIPNVVRLNARLSYVTPINDETKHTPTLLQYTHTHTHTHTHIRTDMWAACIRTTTRPHIL